MSGNRYNKTRFLLSAPILKQCPPDNGKEVAFAGRSNVGKSSVINAITGNNKLARFSKTPGRTQQLVFFSIESEIRLVDLPGYGYAKVPENVRQHWGLVLQDYFRQRRSLAGLFLIMDIRHPLKPNDIEMLEWCRAAELPVHILLNKADKMTRTESLRTLQSINSSFQDQKKISIQLFSAQDHRGIEQARETLDDWLYG